MNGHPPHSFLPYPRLSHFKPHQKMTTPTSSRRTENALKAPRTSLSSLAVNPTDHRTNSDKSHRQGSFGTITPAASHQETINGWERQTRNLAAELEMRSLGAKSYVSEAGEAVPKTALSKFTKTPTSVSV